MRSIIGKAILICSTVLIGICTITKSIYAETAKTVKNTHTYLFAVPEGGWSSVKLEVVYTEFYTKENGHITMSRRQKGTSGKLAYATERPSVVICNVEHLNGKIFSTWEKQSVLYDPTQWDWSSLYQNTESVAYDRPGTFDGKLYYSISCYGAVPPYYVENIAMSFSYK